MSQNGENGNGAIPSNTVERLLLYERLLQELLTEQREHVFSHELADMANNSAAQVRRDVMMIGFSGSPTKGYSIRELVEKIALFFHQPQETRAVLVGAGNLGRALLTHVTVRGGRVRIAAACDSEPSKIGKTYSGVQCENVKELPTIVSCESAILGLLTVPPHVAQHVADLMIVSGIRGIMNFAPVPLKVPRWVICEDVDITAKLEKLAFFSNAKTVINNAAQ